jgi:hypothetical protein
MDYNKKYIVFSSDQLPIVDFSTVLETSQYTVRKSVNGQKTFVKWFGNDPEFLNLMQNLEGPYDEESMNTLLASPEWLSAKSEI